MKDIYLLPEDTKKLKPFAEDIFHIESDLYEIPTDNKTIIYKIFNDYMYKKLMNNRIKKTEYFLNHPNENITNPLYKIFISNFFAGYAMEKFERSFSLDIYCSILQNDSDKLEMILKLIQIIKEVHQQNIIIGDLNYNNILTNGRKIKLCDVDSFGIKGSICTTTPYIISYNNYINPLNICTIESDVYILYLILLNIILDYDIKNIAKINIKEYQASIKQYNLPSEWQYILLNLYDMVNKNSELIYPDKHIDSFKDYLRIRKK